MSDEETTPTLKDDLYTGNVTLYCDEPGCTARRACTGITIGTALGKARAQEIGLREARDAAYQHRGWDAFTNGEGGTIDMCPVHKGKYGEESEA